MIMRAFHRARYAFGTLEVTDFAKFLEIVEFPCPIRPQHEDIHPIFLDVLDLLPDMVLDDDLVSKTGFPDIFDTRHQGVDHVQLASGLVETFRRDADNQIIAQRLGAFEQPVVAFMKEVKGTVCYYFFHFLSPPCFASSCSQIY